jgi:hypothetical protein
MTFFNAIKGRQTTHQAKKKKEKEHFEKQNTRPTKKGDGVFQQLAALMPNEAKYSLVNTGPKFCLVYSTVSWSTEAR